jgi:hypothetical protein
MRPEKWLIVDRKSSSGEALIDAWQEAAEFELVWASGFSGSQIGIGPVAAFSVHFAEHPLGF